jgi:hypothetical protein
LPTGVGSNGSTIPSSFKRASALMAISFDEF